MGYQLISKPTMTLSCLQHVKRTTDGKRPAAPPQVAFMDYVVDRSGSMSSYGRWGAATPSNKLIGEQMEQARKSGIPTQFTLTTFDDVSEQPFTCSDLGTAQLPNLAELNDWMKPRNCTRLIDTAMASIDSLMEKANRFRAKANKEVASLLDTNSLVMVFALFTDGYDNASKFSSRDLNRKMKVFEKEGGVGMFLAANQDAVHTGSNFGFSVDRSLTVGTTGMSATAALRGTSDLMRSATTGEREASYSQAVREESCPFNGGYSSDEDNMVNFGVAHRV